MNDRKNEANHTRKAHLEDRDDKERDIATEILEGLEQAVEYVEGLSADAKPVRVHQVDEGLEEQ